MALPQPTFPNYGAPDFLACDQLFSKTDWLITDISSGVYIGPDLNGTKQYGSNPAGLPIFDLRPYRAVHLYVYCSGLTGGTTPTILASMLYYDSLTPHPGNFIYVGGADTQSIAAAGGGLMMVAGEGGAIPVSNTGLAKVNTNNAVTITYKPLFVQLQLSVTGTPTGLTGLRTFFYGVR